jgi:hypothetical protein
MRKLVMMMVLALTAGCGSVDEPPLGGPYGGSTGGTDPNGGQNANQGGGGGGGTNTGGGGGGGGGGSTVDAGGGGGGGSTDSGSSQQTPKDSGSSQTPQDSGSSQQQNTAPTWSSIYSSYLSGCKSCHGQCSGASNTYTWLKGKGYISGTSSALVDPNQSCLSWYGGNMPPNGGSNSAAVKAMDAWAAAGAANN